MRLQDRHLRAEVMDNPSLDPALHADALAGLRRLNAASRAATSLWGVIRRATGIGRGDSLSVLDVASGGGDVSLGVWRAARADGVTLDVLGLDFSETAIAYATEQTPADARVSFALGDALSGDLPGGRDVVMSSLFFHHLEACQARQLLRSMTEAAGRLVAISDLRRSGVGMALAVLACRTLSRSPVVHTDGPRSVEGAFRIDEFRQLAVEAGIEGLEVRPAWPQRFIATWQRTQRAGVA